MQVPRRGPRTRRSSPAAGPSSTASATTTRRRSHDGAHTRHAVQGRRLPHTAAFIASFVLSPRVGARPRLRHLRRSFFRRAPGIGSLRAPEAARPPKCVDDALAWLAGRGAAPFFAWVHLYDPHAPYNAAGAVRRAVRGLALRRRGRVRRPAGGPARSPGSTSKGCASKTLVVVTSDHGEGLGEHGEDEHMLLRLRQHAARAAHRGVARHARRRPRASPDSSAASTCWRPCSNSSGCRAARPAAVARRRTCAAARASPTTSRTRRASTAASISAMRRCAALRSEGWKYIDAPRAGALQPARRSGGDEEPARTCAARSRRVCTSGCAAYDSARTAHAHPRSPPTRVPSSGWRHWAMSADRRHAAGAPRAPIPRTRSARCRLTSGISTRPKADQGRSVGRRRARPRQVGPWRDHGVRGRGASRPRLPPPSPIHRSIGRLRRGDDPRSAQCGGVRIVGRAYAGAGGSKTRSAPWTGAPPSTLAARFFRGKRACCSSRLATPRARSQRSSGRALSTRRTCDLRLALSALYRDQGEVPKAIAELRRPRVAADPKSADAWNALGGLLAQSGAGREAVAAFRSGLAVKAGRSRHALRPRRAL